MAAYAHSRTRCSKSARSTLALVAALLSATASADVFQVNTFDDENDGSEFPTLSLREAVLLASGTTGPDEILLQAGTYELTIAGAGPSGDLDILYTDLTISGAGMGQTIIDANGIDRVFQIDSVFVGGVDVVMRDLSITGGRPPGTFDAGGGILLPNNCSLTLERVELFGNSAPADGGAIFAYTNLTVIDCVIRNNSCGPTGNPHGGAIMLGGSAHIERTLIANNSAPSTGGGISTRQFLPTPPMLTLIDCAFVGNTSNGDGALQFQVGGTTLNASGCLFDGNRGVLSSTWGTDNATFENCTFVNSVTYGVFRWGFGAGTLNLINCTLLNNTGAPTIPGAIGRSGGTVNMKNTIVAYNTGGGAANIVGQVNSQGYNLVTPNDFATWVGNTTGNIYNADPMLGALAANGGPTQTVALMPGSPAIDAANPGDYPAVDQRGFLRPADGDGNGSILPDIGAYESSGAPPFPDCNLNGVDDAVDIANGDAFDCNGNGIPDTCDLASGVLVDNDGTGVPDSCESMGDLNGDGGVGGGDVAEMLAEWGPCGPSCPADLSGDGVVDGLDLAFLLGAWTE